MAKQYIKRGRRSNTKGHKTHRCPPCGTSSSGASTGRVYARGLAYDWTGQDASAVPGTEAQAFTDGLLDYEATGTLNSLTKFDTLTAISAAGSTQRFQVIPTGASDITVDHLTGKAWAHELAGTLGSMNWADAVNEAANANTAALHGKTNWRLPTIRELFSIANNSTANVFGYLGVAPDVYWASTVDVADPNGTAAIFYSASGTSGSQSVVGVAGVILVSNYLP